VFLILSLFYCSGGFRIWTWSFWREIYQLWYIHLSWDFWLASFSYFPVVQKQSWKWIPRAQHLMSSIIDLW